jgi:phospholipase C
MIEWRWGLAPLTPRDAHARNLAEVLDFSRPPRLSSPVYDAPAVVAPGCAADTAVENQEQYAEWGKLRDIALKHGWELPT